MGRASKDKGKRGEREVAALLRRHGFSARRGQQFCGASGDADVVGMPGYHVEVKRTERFDLYGALRQAEADARDGEVPIVFHRRNGMRWVVVMDAEDFLRGVGSGDAV